MTAASTVEELAGKLSEAQRRYMLGEGRSMGSPPVWIICFDGAVNGRTRPTRDALTREGLLWWSRFGSTTLTPLGLAVRAYLQDQANG